MNPDIKKTIADPEIYKQTRHRDQGYQRVATLLLTLDLPEQVRVLQQLSPAERERVLNAIAETGQLSTRDVERVQEEFGISRGADPGTTLTVFCGGESVACKLLAAAFGESAGSE